MCDDLERVTKKNKKLTPVGYTTVSVKQRCSSLRLCIVSLVLFDNSTKFHYDKVLVVVSKIIIGIVNIINISVDAVVLLCLPYRVLVRDCEI